VYGAPSRSVDISLLHPWDHFIHQMISFREEFMSALFIAWSIWTKSFLLKHTRDILQRKIKFWIKIHLEIQKNKDWEFSFHHP
jgi:hypothetical protein